jgi:hypothetical protein
MAADVSSKIAGGDVSSVTATAVPILLGLKYYFPPSTYGRSVRPYASALVGPIIGSQTTSKVGTVIATESRTDMAVGGQVGAGLDFVISRHFAAEVAIGYNLMSDFEEPIGGRDNYNGGAFSLGFGYLF